MNELFDVLLHPSRWSTAEELSKEQRVTVALFILALFAFLAVIVGWLCGVWARSRAAGGASNGDRMAKAIRGLRRNGVVSVTLWGGYLAFQVLPLPRALENVSQSVCFVL